MTTQEEYEKMSASEKEKEDWMNAKWRPAMGWMYMLVCLCDFVAFPVLWSIYHAILHTGNVTQWQPLTLQGAGLFHLAMGAIIGVAAFGRTQEKLAGANNGGMHVPGMGNTGGFGGGFGSSSPAPNTFGSPSPSAGGFGSPSPAPSFGSAPAPSFGGAKPSPAMGSLGKPMPVPQDDPVL